MRKIIIIAIGIIVITTVIFLLILFHGNLTSPNTQQFSPSPTSLPLPTNSINQVSGIPVNTGIPSNIPYSLQFLTSTPQNDAKNVGLSDAITISFTRNISPGEIAISSFPIVSFSQKYSGKDLILTPKTTLLPNTMYQIYITVQNPQATTTISFSTIGDNPQGLNTYPGINSTQNSYAGDKPADAFLANRTPYDTNTFKVFNRYSETPTGHFYFIVQLFDTDPNGSRKDFLDWLQSLGLKQSDIDQLDISYQNP